MDQYEFSNTAVATALNDGTGINATDTSIVVDDGSSYPTANYKIQMESEVILIVSRSGNTMTVSTTPDGRGWDGTTAASHADNTPVKLVASAEEMSQVPRNSWLDRMFRRPSGESAHTDDDEFDTDSSGSWTAVNPASAAHTLTIDGHLANIEYSGQAASDMSGRMKALTPSSAPITIEACLHHVLQEGVNHNVVGIGFSNGTATTSSIIYVGYNPNTSGTSFNVRTGTFDNVSASPGSITNNVTGGFPLPLFLRLVWKTGTTFLGQFSGDGVFWWDMDWGTDTFSLTPSHFGMMFSRWGGGGTGPQVAYDYIRVYESDRSV